MGPSPRQLLIEYARAFRTAGLPYMVVGALAVSVWGFPRASNDIDFVVHTAFSDRGPVAELLQGKGHTDIDERSDEFGKRLAVALGPSLVLEIFFTPRNVVYDREYDRRIVVEYEGEPIPFLSPEDLILRKLVNTRLRRGLDYDDVVGVIAVQGDALDLDYVRAHAPLYRVDELLERAVADAREAAGA